MIPPPSHRISQPRRQSAYLARPCGSGWTRCAVKQRPLLFRGSHSSADICIPGNSTCSGMHTQGRRNVRESWSRGSVRATLGKVYEADLQSVLRGRVEMGVMTILQRLFLSFLQHQINHPSERLMFGAAAGRLLAGGLSPELGQFRYTPGDSHFRRVAAHVD